MLKNFVSLLLLYFALYSAALAETSKLRVGAILPLTGSAQLYGVPCKNGLEMAAAELRSKYKGDEMLEVVYEDDAFQPARTVTAFKRLVDQDHVDVIVVIASTPSNAIAPLAEMKGIPTFAWASDTRASYQRSFVVRTYTSGYQEGKLAAEYSLEKGYKKAATLVSINDYPTSVRSGFAPVFGEKNIILAEEFSANTSDFRPFIAKLKRSGAETLFLCLNPGENSVFGRQLLEYNALLPIIGCENLDDVTEYQRAGGGLDGAKFVTGVVANDFVTRYLRQYKDEGTIAGASVHYDFLKSLDTLLREAGRDLRGKALLDALFKKKTFESTVGTVDVVNRNGDQFYDFPLGVKELKDGKFIEVSED